MFKYLFASTEGSPLFPDKSPPVTMSPNPGMQIPFTVTCLRASAQTRAAAPRRGQPVCLTCRFAPCPSQPPSHPFLRTSQCLASGVPSHSVICLLWLRVQVWVFPLSEFRCSRALWLIFDKINEWMVDAIWFPPSCHVTANITVSRSCGVTVVFLTF